MPYKLVRATKATPLAPARWELQDDSGYMAASMQRSQNSQNSQNSKETWTSESPSGDVLASAKTRKDCVEKTLLALRPLTCEHCGTTFSVNIRLRLHLRRTHSEAA